MARAWQDAEGARAFLWAVEEGTPASLRTEIFAEWIGWARGRADALDPLYEPARIPKPVELPLETIDAGVSRVGLEPPSSFRQPPGVGAAWAHEPAGPRPGRG
jgi:hypothetical protein